MTERAARRDSIGMTTTVQRRKHPRQQLGYALTRHRRSGKGKFRAPGPQNDPNGLANVVAPRSIMLREPAQGTTRMAPGHELSAWSGNRILMGTLHSMLRALPECD